MTGGSPYGAATITGGQGQRMPSANELDGAASRASTSPRSPPSWPRNPQAVVPPTSPGGRRPRPPRLTPSPATRVEASRASTLIVGENPSLPFMGEGADRFSGRGGEGWPHPTRPAHPPSTLPMNGRRSQAVTFTNLLALLSAASALTHQVRHDLRRWQHLVDAARRLAHGEAGLVGVQALDLAADAAHHAGLARQHGLHGEGLDVLDGFPSPST